MKYKFRNRTALLFAFVCVLLTALLHKKEGPLNPLNLHETAYLAKHLHAVRPNVTAFYREQHHAKIEKKKLRIRYKGSEVRFQINDFFRPTVVCLYVVKAYTLHKLLLKPLQLKHLAALRAPPAPVVC